MSHQEKLLGFSLSWSKITQKGRCTLLSTDYVIPANERSACAAGVHRGLPIMHVPTVCTRRWKPKSIDNVSTVFAAGRAVRCCWLSGCRKHPAHLLHVWETHSEKLETPHLGQRVFRLSRQRILLSSAALIAFISGHHKSINGLYDRCVRAQRLVDELQSLR